MALKGAIKIDKHKFEEYEPAQVVRFLHNILESKKAYASSARQTRQKRYQSSGMTVAQLKKALERFPDDYQITAHEKDCPYAFPIHNIYISNHDKKEGLKRVLLQG
jgi:hypothetical protein